jgi:hypothetical protein
MRESRLANFYLATAILTVSLGVHATSSVSARHVARQRRSERRAHHVTKPNRKVHEARLIGDHIAPASLQPTPELPNGWTIAHQRETSIWALALQEALQQRQAAQAAQPAQSTPASTASTAGPSVSSAVYAAWSNVNMCEEGGDWYVQGSSFSGGLGISNANWVAFGGTEFAPDAGDATPTEQIIVAQRIQPDPPDQDGCTGGW